MEVQFFKFSSERIALLACQEAGLGTPNQPPNRGSTHWIGTIWHGGRFDYEARRVLAPPMAYAGYHVNYKGPVVATLAKYRVFPKSPSFTFS